MIGVGTFELGVGLSMAALILYFVFRDQVSPLILVLLVVVLSPIPGIVFYPSQELLGQGNLLPGARCLCSPTTDR